MNTAVELFIIGIMASFGPCLAFCTPVVLPYIAATRKGWREGLKAVSIFLFARLFVYMLLGLLAGLLGGLLTRGLHQFNNLIFLVGGLIISLLGLLIILGKEPVHRLCTSLRSQVVDNNFSGPLLLALTVTVLPCLPLLGVLAYIALEAHNFWQGAFYGFAFGIGKFISPLIPLSVLASVLPAGLIKNQRIYSLFSRLCGLILFFIGVNLVVFRVWG